MSNRCRQARFYQSLSRSIQAYRRKTSSLGTSHWFLFASQEHPQSVTDQAKVFCCYVLFGWYCSNRYKTPHVVNQIIWSACQKLAYWFLSFYKNLTPTHVPLPPQPSRDYQKCWMLVFWTICFMLFSSCTEKRNFISYEILSCKVKCFTILLKYSYHCLIKQYTGAFLMVRFIKSLYLRLGDEDNICLIFFV